MKSLFSLFFTMFKIGLFTFGGGYAMVPIIERELVEKKKWISNDDFLNILAIAESTPGPLAVNTATFVGYKIKGFFGSLFATLGVVLPSFIIIFCISLFFDEFLQLQYVAYAFNGIRVCVAFLILSAGLKMFLKLEKNIFNCLLCGIALVVTILLTLFSINFSTIFLILIGGFIGLFIYLIFYIRKKSKDNKSQVNESEDGEGKDA